MGNSPKRKCRPGIGEDLLSLRKPGRILLWNRVIDFITAGLMGRAERPDLNVLSKDEAGQVGISYIYKKKMDQVDHSGIFCIQQCSGRLYR